MKIRNAKTFPDVYYGLHMVEGTAEYSEPGSEPYRIYIGEETIKNMNPTFAGKPVYVDHVDEVDLANLQNEADGYVSDSFFNPVDGKNWVKFIVVSDRAKDAIRAGWKLSNAYVPKGFASGGENHGVSYTKEVTSGEYEHLAIVQHPRYEESVILTPEQFKAYNEEKKTELLRLANSKEEKQEMKLNIFKRVKVENTKEFDLSGLMVELPKSKAEMLLTEVVEKYDAVHNMHGYANGDHMVKLGEDEMSVNDLVKKHIEMCNSEKERMEKEKANAGEGEPGKDIEDCQNGDEMGEVGDRGGDESLENEGEDDMPDQKKENEEDEDKKEDVKKNASDKAAAVKKAQALKNARARVEEVARVEIGIDQIARGKSRYGSN